MTRQLRDDLEYWDALAKKVAATAVRESNPSACEWLGSSRAGWLTAALLLAAVWMFGALADRESDVTRFREEWPSAVVPSDDIGKVMVGPGQPPAIGTLLLTTPMRRGQ